MDPIYVTGHRNPDTDSIVSAMAYAALRNTLGDREYQAARLGHISDETQLVLDRFGFEPPVLINSMYTQVRDLEYDTPPALGAAVTVGSSSMRERTLRIWSAARWSLPCPRAGRASSSLIRTLWSSAAISRASSAGPWS